MTRANKLQLLLTCSIPFAWGATAQSVSFPNGNPGDWTDNASGNPATINVSGTGGPGGGGYAQIQNVDNEFQNPGYGAGPYSLFGGGITTSHAFEQSVDVYINANWAAPTPSYAQSFWIDMTPNTTDGDFGAEHNFRLTATGSSVGVTVDGQTSPIDTIIKSGWYDFQMTFQPGSTPTSLVTTEMNIYSVNGAGNPGALMGNTTVVSDSPGGPTLSDELTGSGYVWFPVWANGSASDPLGNADTLGVADLTASTISVPDGASTVLLLGVGFFTLAGLRRFSKRA